MTSPCTRAYCLHWLFVYWFFMLFIQKFEYIPGVTALRPLLIACLLSLRNNWMSFYISFSEESCFHFKVVSFICAFCWACFSESDLWMIFLLKLFLNWKRLFYWNNFLTEKNNTSSFFPSNFLLLVTSLESFVLNRPFNEIGPLMKSFLFWNRSVVGIVLSLKSFLHWNGSFIIVLFKSFLLMSFLYWRYFP